ncbi:unnamed protein product [Fusarium graminearum]|nr:unnamed protein product [Fusarium graminearum]CAG1980493.1 unnamed protein product [Fusarium graminearum]CAG1981662.1 unnamed protein product [Fusarium graminearum]CAG2008294.1 unnamed protein product [Fusarium graminearum]VTO90488.1 unnamed protein product [Fusarium graminearum]
MSVLDREDEMRLEETIALTLFGQSINVDNFNLPSRYSEKKGCTRDATTQLVKDIVEEKEKSTVETNELDILAKRPTNMTSVEVGTAG